MKITGTLTKMLTEYQDPIRYYLNFKSGFVDVNQVIGKNMSVNHIAYECQSCGLNKPIFRMGFCKNCFFTVPEANPSILKPELSTAHLGEEQRDLEWEQKFELQPHIVYLALSGGLKVGVTREKQVPYRWIDQGASQAMIFAETKNRYEAGMLEVLLKENLADKTNWQRMLKNENPDVDLIEMKHEQKNMLSEEQVSMYSTNDKIWEIHYPIETYPSKVKSLTLSKVPEFTHKLIGIRGQYLIFEDGVVFNVRNHEGYVVDLSIA
ncbi:DUF2797 domain-containing protein [Flavobacteriaceae bacterium Ap0902]|nr:DUF2797 domain-containing protein [Flavobacteriaceae bacterium Ap0902]